MTGKMKVCLIAPPFLPVPAVKGGGRETLIELLVMENEKKRLLDLHVLSPFDEAARKFSRHYPSTKFTFLTNKGATVYKRSAWKLARAYQRYLKPDVILNPYYVEVAEFLASAQFDLVIDEAGPHPDLRGISRLIGIGKTGIHLHCVADQTKELHGLSGFSISVSDYVRSRWMSARANEEDDYVVCNGVDTSLFTASYPDDLRASLRGDYGFKDDDFVVLYCGRIAPEKGLIQLFRAIERVRDHRVKLLIAGEKDVNSDRNGNYFKEVIDRVEASDSKYRYLGYVDNRKLKDVYCASDVQVIPTICEEAAGLVAIEGMLSGLPQIGANSGGLVEYVDESCSVVVDRGENFVNGLADAIVKLLNDVDLRASMSDSAVKRGTRFSSSVFYSQFCDALESHLAALENFSD